jgi:two-component system chemotaxis sensor kinase CheA
VYAGATIMGDGRVALIIDVLGMAQRAHVVSEVRDRTLNDQESHAPETTSARQTLLVLEVGERRLALPISQVARLEEISPAAVEQADGQEMVQYRGQILPLLRLGEMLGIPARPRCDAPLQVVVYFQGGRSIGLIVDRIADIVACDLDVQRRARRAGLLASAVIQERVTDLLDVPALVRRVDSTFFDEATLEGTPA